MSVGRTVGRRLGGVQLIITDWSGVISDDRRMVYESNMRLLEKHGESRRTFESWLEASQLTCAAYLASVGLRLDPAIVSEEYSAMLSTLRSEGFRPTVYPDAQEFVLGVNGRPVVVVSSHPEDHLVTEANEYGLTSHIAYFSGSIVNKAEAITRVLSIFLPSQALYMGDTVFDIRAAKQAGVTSVGIATGYHTKDRLVREAPDHVFSSLTELLAEL